MSVDEVRAKAAAMMPAVLDDLGRLVGYASVSFPGFPDEPVRDAAVEVVEILKRAGLEDVGLVNLGGGRPVVWGEIPAPPGAPTVLLYAHYDVQPAPPEQGWATDPWTLTRGDDGRWYGRGAADDKSGVVIHAATLAVFGGKPPVGVRVCIEGEEETLSHLGAFIEEFPERFEADLVVVADMGNLVPGEPVMTTTLRGDVNCTVEVRTIAHPLHSGVFGGPAPDALVTLIRLLDALWDENGTTLVPGLGSHEWTGAAFPEDQYREQAGVLPGVELIGDATVASRLWSMPNVTVIGLDAPPTADAGNVLIPCAKARLSMRIAPGDDADRALESLATYLESHVPWGASVVVDRVKAFPPFVAPSGGPGVAAARAALADAYGVEPSEVGSGGSIPLLATFAKASPGTEFVLWGAEDVAHSRIHGANESVDPDEIERMIVAQARLFERLSAVWR